MSAATTAQGDGAVPSPEHAEQRMDAVRSALQRYGEHEQLRREIQAGTTPERAAEIAARQAQLGGDVYSASADARGVLDPLPAHEMAEVRQRFPELLDALPAEIDHSRIDHPTEHRGSGAWR